MTISHLTARPILTSRGTWTIEVTVGLSDGSIGVASCPEGKSTGSYEACVVPVTEAIQNIEKDIKGAILGINWQDQEKFDTTLLELDGTPDKSVMGANSLLAVSIANCKAQAAYKKIPLWKHIAQTYDQHAAFPKLFANLINGGVHADSGLPYQEYLVVPQASHPEYSIHTIARFYSELRTMLREKYGEGATALGDEGGFTPQCQQALEPFNLFEEVRENLHLEADLIKYGLDIAANEVTSSLPTSALYAEMIKNRRVVYLEDPFGEDDVNSFAELKKSAGDTAWIVGDDLTTTNVKKMMEAHDADALSGIIIKPNQIGTVTEAIKAVRKAREYSWNIIVSHRSGETEDTFITDLAVGVGADGFKLGAPARGERTVKYNRLLAIVDEMV